MNSPSPVPAAWRAFLLCALTVSVSAQTPPAVVEPLRGIEAFIEKEMARDKVPGLAIAVVKDGRVLYAKGFGFRDVEKKLPVTPRTVFAIGSITKSFTVATLGALAQQGRLDWDKPVRETLADFQLHDRDASERITPRDLVTHRSGLPRHDHLWYQNDLSRRDYYLRLRHLEPSADLRARYQYNNLMFLTAGYLAGEIAGVSWEELVQREIFRPLGMSATTTAIEGLKKAAEPAVGYRENNQNAVVVMPYTNIDAIAPAGAINSNVEDMSRYMLMYLNGGHANGRQVVAAQTVQEMMAPHIAVPEATTYAETGSAQYGMGLQVTSYRGRRHVQHGGAIDGFIANMSLLPDDKLGVIVLTNLNQSRAIHKTVTYRVYDRLLQLADVDWASRFAAEKAKTRAAEAAAGKRSLSPRKAGTNPAHPLGEYAGTYEHPAYGSVKIGHGGSELTVAYRDTTTRLTHYHYEVFQAAAGLGGLSRRKLMFSTDVNGDLASVAIKLEPEVNEIVFVRRPDARLTEPSVLAAYAGRYEVGATIVTVSLRGDNVLMLEAPGSPARELFPVADRRFRQRNRSGHSVEFVRRADGAVTGLALYGPTSESVGDRVSDARISTAATNE